MAVDGVVQLREVGHSLPPDDVSYLELVGVGDAAAAVIYPDGLRGWGTLEQVSVRQLLVVLSSMQ